METDQLNNNKIYLDLPNGTRVPVGGSGAWVGTKEEFELAVEEGKIADGTQVIITDDYESGITASMTLYSNAQSGLVATNVQSALDELDSTVDTLNSTVDTLNSNLSKSTFGTQTSIDFDTNFTCPVDGYVRLARSSASGLHLVLIIDGVWASRLSAVNDMTFVYVRKNMVIQYTGSDTDGSLVFYPLT